jgi:hypothetical protein
VIVVKEGGPQTRREGFRHHQEQLLDKEDEIEGEGVQQGGSHRQLPIPANHEK